MLKISTILSFLIFPTLVYAEVMPINNEELLSSRSLELSLVAPFPQMEPKYSVNLNYKRKDKYSVGFALIRDMKKYSENYTYNTDYIIEKGIYDGSSTLSLPLDSETTYNQTKWSGNLFGRYYFYSESGLVLYSTLIAGRSSGWNITETVKTTLDFSNQGILFKTNTLKIDYNVHPYYFISTGLGFQIFFDKIFDGMFLNIEFGLTYNINVKETVTASNDPSRFYFPQLNGIDLFIYQELAKNKPGFSQSSNFYLIPWIGYSKKL